MTNDLMKRIEERANKIAMKFGDNATDVFDACMNVSEFVLEELAKGAGEFDALSADKEAQEHAIGLNMPGERELICLHKFIAGARWQHSQLAPIIAALKMELAQKNESGCCIVEHGYRMQAEKKLDRLKSENQRLREALEFYADKTHWKELRSEEGHEGFVAKFSLSSDHGVIARKALDGK